MITCTRPSTLAAALNDKSGLIYSGYLQSTALLTLSRHPDLVSRLMLVNGKDWRDYKPLHQELEARYGKKEASEGTNIHSVVSALHAGYDIAYVPEPTKGDGLAVYEYIQKQDWKILYSEAQVATLDKDLLTEQCAGTFDLMLESTGGEAFIADVKSVATPSEGKYQRLAWSIQLAIYAHGEPYLGGEYLRDQYGRPTLDEKKVGVWNERPSRKAGLILEVVRGRGTVTPYWIDLQKGLVYANIACNIRALRDNANPLIKAPW